VREEWGQEKDSGSENRRKGEMEEMNAIAATRFRSIRKISVMQNTGWGRMASLVSKNH
jgi:hypothetical protein